MSDSTVATVQAPTASTGTPQPPWTPIKVLKGALVAISRTSTSKTVVAFQYNPILLSRNLCPIFYQSRGDRFNATAKQTIDITITLDASDDGGPQGNGILPQLATLELLVNPSSTTVTRYLKTAQSLKVEIVPPLAPRLLFVWGPNRVLPVRLQSLDVKEKEFNTSLNPIFAEVTLKLEVFPFDEAGDSEYNYLLGNLQKLETLSAMTSSSGVDIGVDPSGLT
jgi:hypothetical protein